MLGFTATYSECYILSLALVIKSNRSGVRQTVFQGNGYCQSKEIVMNRPTSSVHTRSFLVLLILGFLAIILSILPGNAQAASHLPAQAATQAPTQAGTQAPSGPVLDKLNPGESKLGTISAQNTEYRYTIAVKASDQVLAGVTGDEGFTPALELHAGAADKPGSQLTIGLANQIFGSSL